MGLTIKNKETYELGNNLTEFFSLTIDEQTNQDEYNDLKDKIYSLDIDSEEKANIINKINSLSTMLSSSQRKKLLKEIDDIKNRYSI
jgi:hypothetical protein